MKNTLIKSIFILKIVLIFPILFLKAENSKLITQLKIYDNDTTYRYLYIYENERKVLETKYFLDNESWKPLMQTEWTYNDNNCIKQIERVFNTNKWTSSYEINTSYLEVNKHIEIHSIYNQGVEQQFKKVEFQYENSVLKQKATYNWKNNSWELIQTTLNKYLNNTLVEILISNTSSDSTNFYRYTLNYNADSTLKSQLLEEKSTHIDWHNVELTNWYYTSSKQLHSQKSKHWNSAINKWENTSMFDYLYTNNKLTSEIYYYWKSMFWGKNIRYDYIYNENGDLLKKLLLLPIYREWRNTISINYLDFVDNKSNKMESVLGFWGGQAGDLISSYVSFNFNDETEIKKAKQIFLSYEKIDNTIVTSQYNTEGKINVYPNPSDDYFYFNIEEYDAISWSLYNTNGQLIKQQELTNRSGVIDLSNFPKGIYFLKVKTKDKTLNQKISKK